jgi:hypothetical protein
MTRRVSLVFHRVALTITLVGLVLMRVPYAQSKPDFSGTWTMDEARSVSAHYPDFVGPVVVVITQTPNEITVETKRGPKSSVLTYRIVEAQPTPAGATSVTPAEPFKAYWDGARLVSEGLREVPSTVRSKEVRTLSGNGREMTVETTVIVDHGYTEAGAQTYATGKDVFTKAP